jgi:hypothetical protein
VCVLVGRAIQEADTQFRQQLAFGYTPIPVNSPTPYQDHCQHIMQFLWWTAIEETSFPGAISLFPVHEGKGARWAQETITRSIMLAAHTHQQGAAMAPHQAYSPMPMLILPSTRAFVICAMHWKFRPKNLSTNGRLPGRDFITCHTCLTYDSQC